MIEGEEVTYRRTARGVALTREALSPEAHGGMHTLWWAGPSVRQPGAMVWAAGEEEAATYRDEVAAYDAFTLCQALSGYRHPLAWPQFDLFDPDP